MLRVSRNCNPECAEFVLYIHTQHTCEGHYDMGVGIHSTFLTNMAFSGPQKQMGRDVKSTLFVV